jgi:hypothetical protein
MAYEQKDNSGSMFINDKKTISNHPDYTGRIMVDGKMYYVSSWYKKPEGKKAFFSIALKPVDAAAAPAAPQAPVAACEPELPVIGVVRPKDITTGSLWDDSLPF